MRTLLKLVVAALILNASWRTGTVYWKYYKFRDAVQEAAQYASNRTVRDLRSRVLAIASEQEVPLSADQLNVRREENHTLIDAAYTDEIELAPTYSYQWQFTVTVNAYSLIP